MSSLFDILDNIDETGDFRNIRKGMDDMCEVLQKMQNPLTEWINSHDYVDMPAVLYLLEMSAAGLRNASPEIIPVAEAIGNLFSCAAIKLPKGGEHNGR